MPLEEQTVGFEAFLPKQMGTSHLDPTHPPTQLQLSTFTHVPCPEHTDALLFGMLKQKGMLHMDPVQFPVQLQAFKAKQSPCPVQTAGDDELVPKQVKSKH